MKRLASLAADKFYFPLLLPAARRQFLAEREKISGFDDLWELSNRFAFGLKRKSLNFNLVPFQKKSEISSLYAAVSKLQPKIVLEIGTAGGGTLLYWTEAADAKAKIISLDLPFGRFGAGYLPTKAKFIASFARDRQSLHLIAGSSHETQTKKQVETILRGEKIDFMFIDGDHTYEGIKADFNLYAPLVRAGGLIALHDIVYHRFDQEAQVYRFWQEIKNHYQNEEFIEAPEQDGYGIGLIHV